MKRNVLLGCAFIITLMIGVGIGGASNAPSPSAAPPTVTKTVEGPTQIVPGGTVTVTGPTVRVTVTPKVAPPPAIADTIEDGLWEVGVDVQIGQYKTLKAIESGSTCYWQISPVGKPDTIIDNAIVTGGRPIVTIKKGQTFESQGCGVWGKTR